ncbi:MAG: hypothetical protein ACOX6V_01500 [Patescibacteria group bacterium]|jgi:hypothetical protein
MLLKSAYTVFIGVLLATFVGVGIAAFYQAPQYPELSRTKPSPLLLEDREKNATLSAEIVKEQELMEDVYQKYQDETKLYNRNVSVISLSASVLLLILSLTLASKLVVIADGLLLGGVLTLLYSIIRGFQSEDSKFRFVVVSIGLVISLVLGYIKFVKNTSKTR